MRASRFANAVCLTAALSALPTAQAAEDAAVAWLRDGKVEVRALAGVANSSRGKVPLGSLWKLFVYAYLAETRAQEPAYACTAKNATPVDEERYCCDPGEKVARDAALARSCAPYFSPARLGLANNQWQAHWQARTTAPWLLNLKHLQPDTEVPLDELLAALAKIAPPARAEARNALLETGVTGYGREAWTRLGSAIRYKTYSWHKPDGSAFGGAAGWLADGTPFWFGARGSSRTALTSWATQLAGALPEPRWGNAGSGSDNASCVDVDFFARYPLRAVWQADQAAQARPGSLKGRYRLQFVNGNWLTITARGDMTLAETPPTISGRFSVNDYIARVIDREGHANSTQAARALAIAARTYLVQNARFESGCWRIADSSRTQRVSPNPPSSGALAAAWFTDEIVLNGATVRYHREAAANNRLAWRDAVARAAEGWDFERILAASYPQATLATLSGRNECARLDAAETWLARATTAWQAKLRREPGFEALDAPPKVCALADGHPYSDQRRLRIYVRGWRSLDERVTLAHEYLHLALRFHPHGADEDYVERLARRLIEG
ncbi:MAG: DUF2300 domain-containing protein [Sulfuricella sp.]|nr:DUF2300 domain-containing protein [Sulfuricella sp.]